MSKASTLDQLLPHSLLQHAINVYFDYVYGLVPIVHRPSFLSDFKGRRDLLPGQEEWTTTLLGVAALTMAQVPWAFRPMSNEEVKGMVGRMYGRIKVYALADEGEVTLARCEFGIGLSGEEVLMIRLYLVHVSESGEIWAASRLTIEAGDYIHTLGILGDKGNMPRSLLEVHLRCAAT